MPFLARFLQPLNLAAGALGGAALALLWALLIHGPARFDAGRNDYAGEMARATVEAEKERNSDDAILRGTSDYDLCVGSLRARGMPVDACEQLRGLSPE